MRPTARTAETAFAGVIAVLPPLAADDYPVRPVRRFIPFAAGGGAPAATLAAQASPDGYTRLMSINSTHGVHPSVRADLRHYAIRGFLPVCEVAPDPHLLLASAALSVRSVRERVEFACAVRGSHSKRGGEAVRTGGAHAGARGLNIRPAVLTKTNDN